MSRHFINIGILDNRRKADQRDIDKFYPKYIRLKNFSLHESLISLANLN